MYIEVYIEVYIVPWRTSLYEEHISLYPHKQVKDRETIGVSVTIGRP